MFCLRFPDILEFSSYIWQALQSFGFPMLNGRPLSLHFYLKIPSSSCSSRLWALGGKETFSYISFGKLLDCEKNELDLHVEWGISKWNRVVPFPILFKQHKKKQTFLLMSVLVLLNLLWIKEVPPSCCLREAVAVSWQWFKNSNNNKTEKKKQNNPQNKQTNKSISGDFSKSLNLVPGSSASFQDHFHTGMRAGSSTSEERCQDLTYVIGRPAPSELTG